MARISFTSEIAELVGKLAGSVFQYSYGGFQVHTRVVPSNPQTDRQQLRRGWLGWIAANWRNLTPTEQGTFIAAAGTIPEAFRLYVGSNINLYLIDEPTVTTYVTSPDPGNMPIDIDTLSPGNFDIIAAGPISTVPADTKLLVFATAEKVLPKRFTSPSEYSPIVYFDEGTDLSSAVSILTEWENLYGVLSGTNRICINAVLIDKTNGHRGADNIICKPPDDTNTFRIIDDDGTNIIDSDGAYVVYPLP
jgi:hypothetical protein